MEITQYDILLVNLDPTVGSEIKKTRPCVVLSPDEMNRHLRTIIIAPMTTRSKNYPTRVKVRHNEQEGWAVIDQIRTIDRTRILRLLGHLSNREIAQIKSTIRETLVD